MNNTQRIIDQFEQSARTIRNCSTLLAPQIGSGAEIMAQALRNGKKLLACGNGGSAADAQHFTGEMLNRYLMERPALPAIALHTDSSTLTAIANDYSFEQVFAKQVEALGRSGDVLLVITTSGNSENILQAVKTAQERGICCVALNGNTGGQLSALLEPMGLEIRVPHESTPRIQEVHGIIIHCLCDLIEKILFTEQ